MSQEKVLIVEDEENERTGLAELVSAWGYRAETASDGAEGYEKVTNWTPSIVITDSKCPGWGDCNYWKNCQRQPDHGGDRSDRTGNDR